MNKIAIAEVWFFLKRVDLTWVMLFFTLAFLNPVYAHSDSTPTNTNQIKVLTSSYRLNPTTGNWETPVSLINYSKQVFYAPVFLEISKIEYEDEHKKHEYEHNRVTLVNTDGVLAGQAHINIRQRK
ncbi:MAG: hypothetical protein WCK96_15135 [Methylococcales bacterium]